MAHKGLNLNSQIEKANVRDTCNYYGLPLLIFSDLREQQIY